MRRRLPFPGFRNNIMPIVILAALTCAVAGALKAQNSDPIQTPRAAKTKKSAASANGAASVTTRLHGRTIKRSRPMASSGGTSAMAEILVQGGGQELRTRPMNRPTPKS